MFEQVSIFLPVRTYVTSEYLLATDIYIIIAMKVAENLRRQPIVPAGAMDPSLVLTSFYTEHMVSYVPCTPSP